MDKDTKKQLKDVDSYSLDDLKTLLGFQLGKNEYTEDDIRNQIRVLKDRYPNLAKSFLNKAQSRLLEDIKKNVNIDVLPKTNTEPKKLHKWWANQFLSQPEPEQRIKYTRREDAVKTYPDENGDHEAMKQERLGILNAYSVPVVQGTLNPNLKNTNQRIVVLDSQFRQNIAPYVNNPNGPASATNYTVDLSDPLTNTLSLKLYSIQIPYTWYVVDSTQGTSCFWLIISGNTYLIQIENGNYTSVQLINAISTKLKSTIPGNTSGQVIDISFNTIDGKSFFFQQTPPFLVDVNIIFYSTAGDYTECNGVLCSNSMRINNNLGWILGFRVENDQTFPLVFERTMNVNNSFLVYSDGPVDTYGTRYLYVVLDDFNQNHLNSGLVNITDTDTRLELPKYYNESLDYVCVADAVTNGQTEIPVYVPSTPRQLTQAQLYSINQILDNRNNTYKFRSSGPTTTDVFAVIPLKKSGLIPGDTIIDFGSSLAYNQRVYFGPVNILRMRLQLVDDKGNTVNLHGNDWSISLIAETLYEY